MSGGSVRVVGDGLEAHAVERLLGRDEAFVRPVALVLAEAVTHPGRAVSEALAAGDRVVVLTSTAEPASQRSFLHAGAGAVVDGDCDTSHLRACLALVAAGHDVVPAASGVLQDWRRTQAYDDDAQHRRAPDLTARETEVLQALAAGMTGKAVAKQLQVSLKTVETHKSNLFSKLGVSNQTQAVSVGIRAGLV